MQVPQDSLSLLPCCEHPLLLICCPSLATCTKDPFLAQDAALHRQKQGRASASAPSLLGAAGLLQGLGGTECGAVREPMPGGEACKELGFACALSTFSSQFCLGGGEH